MQYEIGKPFGKRTLFVVSLVPFDTRLQSNITCFVRLDTMQTDDYRMRREQALANWVTTQKTYYGGLFAPNTAAGVVSLLNQLSGEQRTELLELLRQLHAVASPDR